MSETKFTPGLRVVRESGARHWDNLEYRYAVVDKVHKNGNFTLVGSPQQYRPGSDGRAIETGDGYHRGIVVILTPEMEHKIAAHIAFSARRKSFSELLRAIERVPAKNLTDEFVAALAAAVQMLPSKA